VPREAAAISAPSVDQIPRAEYTALQQQMATLKSEWAKLQNEYEVSTRELKNGRVQLQEMCTKLQGENEALTRMRAQEASKITQEERNALRQLQEQCTMHQANAVTYEANNALLTRKLAESFPPEEFSRVQQTSQSLALEFEALQRNYISDCDTLKQQLKMSQDSLQAQLQAPVLLTSQVDPQEHATLKQNLESLMTDYKQLVCKATASEQSLAMSVPRAQLDASQAQHVMVRETAASASMENNTLREENIRLVAVEQQLCESLLREENLSAQLDSSLKQSRVVREAVDSMSEDNAALRNEITRLAETTEDSKAESFAALGSQVTWDEHVALKALWVQTAEDHDSLKVKFQSVQEELVKTTKDSQALRTKFQERLLEANQAVAEATKLLDPIDQTSFTQQEVFSPNGLQPTSFLMPSNAGVSYSSQLQPASYLSSGPAKLVQRATSPLKTTFPISPNVLGAQAGAYKFGAQTVSELTSPNYVQGPSELISAPVGNFAAAATELFSVPSQLTTPSYGQGSTDILSKSFPLAPLATTYSKATPIKSGTPLSTIYGRVPTGPMVTTGGANYSRPGAVSTLSSSAYQASGITRTQATVQGSQLINGQGSLIVSAPSLASSSLSASAPRTNLWK